MQEQTVSLGQLKMSNNELKNLKESVAFSSSDDVYKLLIKYQERDIGTFFVGEVLKEFCRECLALDKRDAYYKAEAFLNRADTLRTVGIVYGMRSTGKTVILRQLAGRDAYFNQSAYVTLNYDEYSIADIYRWMANLYKMGIRHFMIIAHIPFIFMKLNEVQT